MGLILMFTGAMELVVIAQDLVTLLIGWEVDGRRVLGADRPPLARKRRDAGLQHYAFVMTRAGDLGLFLAVFACFAGAGSVDYAALGQLDGWPLGVAASGILVAAAAKAGQVPFSPWLFRAMAGPTSVSALLHSSTMVAAGAYLVARLYPWLSAAPGFSAAAHRARAGHRAGGRAGGAIQVHAKKVLAGSTSAQLGLMFAAAGAGYPGVAVLHLIAHAAFKAPLFFAAGIAHARADTFDLRRMRLGTEMTVAAGLTAVAALALAGVPPLGGAWTKEEIVKALGASSPWLALLAMAAGGLSAAYATRFAVLAYGPGDADGESGQSRHRPCCAGRTGCDDAWPFGALVAARARGGGASARHHAPGQRQRVGGGCLARRRRRGAAGWALAGAASARNYRRRMAGPAPADRRRGRTSVAGDGNLGGPVRRCRARRDPARRRDRGPRGLSRHECC